MTWRQSKRVRLLPLVSLVSIMTGCAGTRGQDLASHIRTQSDTGATSSHNMKSDCRAETLPLERLIQEAIRNNKEIQARRHESRTYTGKSHYERHEWFPKVESYASYDTQPDPQRSSTKSPVASDRTWRRAYGVRLEQTLWDFGVTRGKVHAESFTAEAYAHKAAMRAVEIAYEVTECYWRVVFFNHVLALRERALAARIRERESIQARLVSRNATEVEVRFSDVQVAQAEKDLLEATHGLHLAKQQLLFFLGREADDAIEIADILWVPSSQPPVSKTVAPTHPKLMRVESAQLAAHAAKRAATGAYLPKIYMRGYLEESKSDSSSPGGNLAPDGYLWSASLNLRLPLGAQWVGATGRRLEAEANQAMLQAERASLESSIRLKLLDAEFRLKEAWKEQEVAEKRRAAVDARLQHVRNLHEARNATHADVAQAEEERARAEIGHWRALYEIRIAEAGILREAGIIPGTPSRSITATRRP